MLHTIPIYAVMVEDLGERGAQYTALRLLQDELKDSKSSLSNNHDNYSIFKDQSFIILSSILLSGFIIGTYTWIKCKK